MTTGDTAHTQQHGAQPAAVQKTTQTLTSQWGQDPLTVSALVPTSMLRYRMGRVHVGTSALDVARDTWDAMAKVNDPRWTRRIRRETLHAALWLHRENRLEYTCVMSGVF